MNLSCSSRMIKYLMFGFNLFFVISGVIIIAVGAAVKTVYTEYAEFLDNRYFSLPNMLIATGTLIFVVCFFGCCGAIKESWIMLGIFSIFLCIIFVFEFASGIAGYVLRDKTAGYLDSTLRQNLQTYNTTHDIWDLIQGTFRCCGVDSYTDWRGIFEDKYALPVSCCPAVSGATAVFYCNSYTTATSTAASSETGTTSETPTVTTSETPTVTTIAPTAAPTTIQPSTASSATSSEASIKPTDTTPVSSSSASRRKREQLDSSSANDPTTPTTTTAAATSSPTSTSDPYSTGCKSAFGDYIKKHAVQIGGCALGLAIVQILGIVFSCHLVRQLKNGYYST